MATISGMHIEITELMPELSGVKDVTLKVGVMDGATNKDGESVAFYASKNEFGTTRIPKRPALRTTLDNGAQKYVNFIASQLKGGGRSLPDIMTILGARYDYTWGKNPGRPREGYLELAKSSKLCCYRGPQAQAV